ncbi:stalk domain-containing protein [Paenibacillus rhizoplanae]
MASKIKLAAPPRMVSGVLMVPLRFVAGVLGARMTPAEGRRDTSYVISPQWQQ